MKRSSEYPERRSNGEFKLNCEQSYNRMIRDAKRNKINPIFLEDHYGIKKDVIKDEAVNADKAM